MLGTSYRKSQLIQKAREAPAVTCTHNKPLRTSSSGYRLAIMSAFAFQMFWRCLKTSANSFLPKKWGQILFPPPLSIMGFEILSFNTTVLKRRTAISEELISHTHPALQAVFPP